MHTEPAAVIRASSLADLFDCAARWEARNLLGKWMPSGAPALIGTATHTGTAVFDQARLDGDKPSVDDALDAVRDTVTHPNYEVAWDGTKPGDVMRIAADLTLHYCREIAPQFTYTAVEQTLDALDITASNGTVLRFTGTLDRQRVEGNQFGTIDFKTGKGVVSADGEVNTKHSGAQLATYELLGMMAADTLGTVSLLPALIIGLPTNPKRVPTIAPVYNPHKVLIGDAQRKGLIDHAAIMVKHGSFPGNPRSMLCSPKYCPIYKSCWFRFQGD